MMTDKELVREVLHREKENAFAQIVHRYSAMVFSRAIGIMHSEEGAAEVTQETFVRAYENLSSWRGTELGPWLSAIAGFTALKLLDKQKRRKTVQIDEAAYVSDESFSDEREVQLQRMETAIATLPELERQLLQLHYYEHLSTAERARRTALSQSNDLVRLHRIRAKLREMMKNDGNETE